jgi:hypothetical protein
MMKDKLYNMIVEKEDALYRENPYMYHSERIEAVANHLIDSGLVIVLPCKVGTMLYAVGCGTDKVQKVFSFTVNSIEEALDYKIHIGKSFYFTKEEAEAKLAEVKGDQNEGVHKEV